MALVTVNTLNGQPVEDVANSLFRRWGIGKKGKDEGLLLLLAIQDHKDRIEVGYGLEPILPDGFAAACCGPCGPRCRQATTGRRCWRAPKRSGSRIAQAKGVTLDATLQRPRRAGARAAQFGIPWPLIIFGLIILFGMFNRGRGGGAGGFLTGMILGNVLGSVRTAGAAAADSAAIDSGGGGGGGGFGGFGGGDSGGGGASGNW